MSKVQKNRPAWEWILVAALVVGIAAAGCRRRGHSYRGHDDPANRIEHLAEHVGDLLDKIEATPEQRRSIQATLDPLIERAKGLAGARDVLRKAYHAEWQGTEFDAAHLNALLEKEVDGFVTFLSDLTEAMAEVHAALSPEQRELLAKHAGRHRKRYN